jgi:hypothetical protein
MTCLTILAAFQLASSETMFEYYFELTLRNGTVLDYPVGRTGFIPAAIHPADPPGADNTVQMRVPMEKQPLAKLDMLDQDVRVERRPTPRDLPLPDCVSEHGARDFFGGVWIIAEQSGARQENEGNRAYFTVDIELPASATFFVGEPGCANQRVFISQGH